MSQLVNFMDKEGKVKSWPSKIKLKVEVLKYIGSKFEEDRAYTEKEVNAIINEWHTFGDFFMIRRGMVDYKFLGREKDGSKYWKISDNFK